MCTLEAAPPEALNAKASVISDLGFPPPSSGAVKSPGPSTFSWVHVILADSSLARVYQDNCGEGWEAGQQAGRDPPQRCWGTWGLAAVSTASSCLQMFFKAFGLRPLTQPPVVAGPDSQRPEREITTSLAGVWGL